LWYNYYISLACGGIVGRGSLHDGNVRDSTIRVIPVIPNDATSLVGIFDNGTIGTCAASIGVRIKLTWALSIQCIIS